MRHPKHILVIRLSAMGDVAMTVPVVRAFSEQHPDVRITVLTRTFFAPFFRDIPGVTVYNADVKGKHKGVFGLYKLAKELNNLEIDVVADLHNVLRTKVLKMFLKAKPFKQIDKGRLEKKQLVSGGKFRQLKTTHDRYNDVFNALGFNINLLNPKFPTVKKLPSEVLKVLGDKTGKWIGIAPFAQYESKMYPLDLMEIVIENLSRNNNYKILLFGGGKNEANLLESIKAKYNNVYNLANTFSLNVELDIISHLDLMVSMDSGNAHIAAMLGKKVITIWGVTHPFSGFYPFHQAQDLAILPDRGVYPKIPTSVYGNTFPSGYQNVTRSITPESVIEKIETSL